MTWVNAVVQGVLLGGLYALFACGLSLLFGVMRIINLAHGDLALLGTFMVFVVTDHLGWSPFAALILVLPGAAAVGWLLQRLMFDRAMRGGELAPLLATFGLSIVIGNLLLETFSADTHGLSAGSIETSAWRISDELSIGALPALIFVVAVLLLGGLQLFLSRTPLGRAMRATADDPGTAELVGIDARRVYATASAIAIATAALAGAFFGMRSSFDPTLGPAQLIFAFEAVVIGGLGSLWGTLVGGIILGVAQAVGAEIDPAWSILSGHIVFLAVLAFRQQGIFAMQEARVTAGAASPPSAAPSSAPAPSVHRWTRTSRTFVSGAGVLLVLLAFIPFAFTQNTTEKLTELFVLIIIAAMWNVLAGYAGLVSVGQQAFIGIGAYGTIVFADHGVNPFVSAVLAALVAGVLSLPVSLLVFRLRGGQFAIGMWVVAEVFRLLVTNDQSVGGGTGRSLTGLNVYDPATRQAYTYWVALAFMALFVILGFVLLRSRLGSSLQAIRDDETAAVSLGVRVTRAKRIVFLLAAVGCGAAGAVTILNTLRVQPDSIFGIQWTAYMIFMVLLGGLGTFEGPVLGALVLFFVQQQFANQGSWYLVGLGAVAIVVTLLFPRGLWGALVDRFELRLMPVGYRVRDLARSLGGRSGGEPADGPGEAAVSGERS